MMTEISTLILACFMAFVSCATAADKNGATLPPLPSGHPGPRPFGAYYTTLKYHPEWDQYWRVGPRADVVVRFDDGGHKFIFWRGTNYIPHWVTDNGIWYTNEFLETWTPETVGCCEPMSDKQCRYSNVRVIESHAARVVIHWRYALVDVKYRIAWPDDKTGWGDWVDEYHFIYPDTVSVRQQELWSSHLDPTYNGHFIGKDDLTHEWQEGIVLYNAGTRPEECVEIDAVHVANMAGEFTKWSWAEHGKPTSPIPENGNIVLMNLKARLKPFVVSPEGCRLYAYPGSQGGSHFRWRDHWPTTLEPTPGRDASGKQAAHGSFFHMRNIPIHQRSKEWVSKVILQGMTREPIAGVVPIARAWLQPPQLELMGKKSGGSFKNEGFDRSQRAYVLSNQARDSKPSAVSIKLAASPRHPVVHPVFLIRNWAPAALSVKINDKKLTSGKDFRVGQERHLERTDTVIWLKVKSTEPIKISLVPVES